MLGIKNYTCYHRRVSVFADAVIHQVERFLDTENATLISMHYPQAQQGVHFGTAPFDNRRDEETPDNALEDSEPEGLADSNGGMSEAGSGEVAGLAREGTTGVGGGAKCVLAKKKQETGEGKEQKYYCRVPPTHKCCSRREKFGRV